MALAKNLVWIGVAAWAISWFVSPHVGISLMKGGAGAVDEIGKSLEGATVTPKDKDMPSGPPGWIAFRFAWDMAFSGKTPEGGDSAAGEPEKSLGFTCLTNFVMALAVLALLFGVRGGGAVLLGMLLLASAAFDAGWLYRTDDKFRSGLESGYWMWLGSFALAGLGFVLRRRAAGRGDPGAVERVFG